MLRKYFVLSFILLLFSAAQAQKVESKKCKDCDKPLKECQYRGKHKKSQTTGSGSNTNSTSDVKIINKKDKDFRRFHIIAGLSTNKENAIRLNRHLRSEGFDPYIIYNAGLYYVGAGSADNRGAIDTLYHNIMKHYKGDLAIKEWKR